MIVFAPNTDGPLHRVSTAGGVSSPVTILDQGPAGSAHRWPWFLPDGRHFLYVAANTGNAALGGEIRVASIDGAKSKVVAGSQFNAMYAQGYLLFLRDNTLMAQPFDAKRLVTTADAVPVAEQVQTLPIWLRGVFSVSENGFLIYGTGTPTGGAQLAWFDRSGKTNRNAGRAGPLRHGASLT